VTAPKSAKPAKPSKPATAKAAPAPAGKSPAKKTAKKAAAAPAKESMETVKVIYRGRKFDLEQRKVSYPDGRTGIHDLIIHNGAAVILAFPAPGEILMVRQYRPAVGEWIMELPAGTLEKGEDPAEAAVRELEEECGFRAGKVEKLCEFHSSPGVMTERMHVYVATKLKATAQNLDEGEALSVRRVPFAEALAMAGRGEIKDAKTLTTLLMWRHKNPKG
jgi:ADP-ribose pyrophosphatase